MEIEYDLLMEHLKNSKVIHSFDITNNERENVNFFVYHNNLCYDVEIYKYNNKWCLECQLVGVDYGGEYYSLTNDLDIDVETLSSESDFLNTIIVDVEDFIDTDTFSRDFRLTKNLINNIFSEIGDNEVMLSLFKELISKEIDNR